MKSVISYIDAQKEHHRKRTFEEEFLEFLDKYGVQRCVPSAEALGYFHAVRFADSTPSLV
jgi:hypothetical protein